MNQFRVECSEVNYFTVLVEAETKDKAKELAEQAQLDAAQALVEATNQQTAQMKANAKQAEQNALISILSQRLGTGSTLLQNNTTGPSTVNCRWVGAFFSCF